MTIYAKKNRVVRLTNLEVIVMLYGSLKLNHIGRCKGDGAQILNSLINHESDVIAGVHHAVTLQDLSQILGFMNEVVRLTERQIIILVCLAEKQTQIKNSTLHFSNTSIPN